MTMIKWILLLTSVIISTTAEDTTCPNLGDAAKCLSDTKDCGENGFWDPGLGGICGICPGCHKYIERDELCEPADPDPCAPGNRCLLNKKNETRCLEDKDNCYYELNINQLSHPSWTPRCNGNYYQAVQCKGERPIGRCFCVDKDGARLYGEQLWAKADNMTCACSRRVQELMNSGRKDVTLHCTPEGNYEKLQCDDGLCWCADEMTGVPTSRILQENMMTMLACYNETETGSQYLRQCESLMIAHGRIEMEMAYHNSINPNFPYTNCDLDGSYGPVQLDGNRLFCSWKDKSAIESYGAEMSGIAEITCRCARDKKMYDSIQMECGSNGNYKTEQFTNDGEKYCVDEDGFLDNCS